jgi:hypothetical protein
MVLHSGDMAEFHLVPQYERLPRNFQIFPGIILPAGTDYHFLRRHYQLQSADQRTLAVNVVYEDGPFYSGGRRQISGTASIRPHAGASIALGADYNDVALAEGRFNATVWRADVNTQFGPFVSLVNRVQYDSLSRGLGWQSRLRWITRPGDDVFVVYTHNWVDHTTLETLDRRGSVKIVRTLRF